MLTYSYTWDLDPTNTFIKVVVFERVGQGEVVPVAGLVLDPAQFDTVAKIAAEATNFTLQTQENRSSEAARELARSSREALAATLRARAPRAPRAPLNVVRPTRSIPADEVSS